MAFALRDLRGEKKAFNPVRLFMYLLLLMGAQLTTVLTMQAQQAAPVVPAAPRRLEFSRAAGR